MKEKYILPIFIGSVLIIFFLFSWYLFAYFDQKKDLSNKQEVQTEGQTSLPIPPSSQDAMGYIDQAMELLSQKKYDEAILILQGALEKYPEDQNLKLNIEYIENIKLRNAQ